MLLSEIVKRVNAKSFGETDYDYDDIYPYFQEAIDSLNSQLDVHRRVADAPRMYAEDAEYNFLLDIYINNYVVTYIVVAMDNASLSVTSRTQTYAAQLEQYKTQTISDLYKWMPVKSTGASMAFDLTGYAGAKTLDVPQVKAWYDESIGGKLSGYGSPIPVKGVRWDNPYGALVVHPKYADYRMKPGSNLVPYVFIPNEYFRQYYKNTIAYVSFYGHNIDFPVRAALNNVYDIGNRAGLNALLLAAWTVLKDDHGMSVVDGPSVVVGSYTDDQGTESVMILQHESGLCFYDIDTGAYYLAAPVDLSATPVEFNKTEIIINSVDLRLQEMQDEIEAHKAQVDTAVAEHKAEVDDVIAEHNKYTEDTFKALKQEIQDTVTAYDEKLINGSFIVNKADEAYESTYAYLDGDGHNIVDTYQTKKVTGFSGGPLAGVTTVNEALTKLNSNALSTANTLVGIQSGSVVAGKASKDADGNDIADTYVKKTLLGIADGVATLDEKCKIPSSQLPSFVDDVLEYSSKSSFPMTGESGKIYLETSTNKSYRWSGSQYAEISSSLALGETSSTAYAGDKGRANAEAIKALREQHANEFTVLNELITKLREDQMSNLDLVDDKINQHILKAVGYESTPKGLFGWVGTAVVSGEYEKIYLNTNLNIEEVVNILTQIEDEYSTGGAVDIFSYGTDDVLSIMQTFNSNSTPSSCFYIGDIDKFSILFAENLKDDYTSYVGWNPDFNGVIEVNGSIVVEHDLSKYSSLFSTTPFELDTGEETTTLYPFNFDGTLNKDKPLSEEVGTMAIATSTNFNKSSDTQVPTTKAVQTMIDNALGNIESLLEAI